MSSAMRMTACEDIHPMSDSSLDHPLIHTDGYGGGDDPAWRRVDWREHQRWIELPGGPVNTISLGDGPPIVFIHGLGGSWTNWLEQLPAFAEDFRVVTLDLPGFGASPLPASGDVSIPAYADAVAAVLARARDRLGDRRRQLDGRLHRRRAGLAPPGARRAPRADLRGGDLQRALQRQALRRGPSHGRRRGGVDRDALARPGPPPAGATRARLGRSCAIPSSSRPR